MALSDSARSALLCLAAVVAFVTLGVVQAFGPAGAPPPSPAPPTVAASPAP